MQPRPGFPSVTPFAAPGAATTAAAQPTGGFLGFTPSTGAQPARPTSFLSGATTQPPATQPSAVGGLAPRPTGFLPTSTIAPSAGAPSTALGGFTLAGAPARPAGFPAAGQLSFGQPPAKQEEVKQAPQFGLSFGAPPAKTEGIQPAGQPQVPLLGAAAPRPAAGGILGAPSAAPTTMPAAPSGGPQISVLGAKPTTAAPVAQTGLLAAPSASAAATTTTAQPTTGFLGAPAAAPTTGLLGAPAAATTSAQPTTGLLGAPTTAAKPTTGLFGAPAATTAAQPATGLLGAAQPATGILGTTVAPTTAAKPTTGLLGAPAVTTAAQPAAGLLGAPAATTAAQPAAGLFGAPAAPGTTKPATTAPGATTGLFAGPSTTAAPKTGLLGAPSATTAPTGGFGLAPAGRVPEEKKAETKEEKKAEYVPLQSLEEMKAAALSTKSLDDILNKWRNTLITLSSDFKETSEEVKHREIDLYQSIEQIRSILQMSDNIGKLFDQQKQQLETISKEQEHLNRCLNSITAELEPYLDRGAELLPTDDYMLGPRTNYLSTREQIFQKSKNINDQLNAMEAGINDVTNSINEADKAASGSSKEMAGIETVFNTYYDTMKWIENSTSEIKGRLENIEETYNLFKY